LQQLYPSAKRKKLIRLSLNKEDLKVLEQGFYLDFHYRKRIVELDPEPYIFRVGLIQFKAGVEEIEKLTRVPAALL
jgi:hypothetical protein